MRQDPMDCSVSDAASILSITASKDEKHKQTLAQPWNSPQDYTQALNFSSLRGARIGIHRKSLAQSADKQPFFDAFDAAIEVMKKGGATIVIDDDAMRGNSTTVLGADFISISPALFPSRH